MFTQVAAEPGGSGAWEDMCRQHAGAQQGDTSPAGEHRGPCVLLRDDASDADEPPSEPDEGTPLAGAAAAPGAAEAGERPRSGRQVVRLRPSKAFLQNWNSHTSFHRRRRSRSAARDRWARLFWIPEAASCPLHNTVPPVLVCTVHSDSPARGSLLRCAIRCSCIACIPCCKACLQVWGSFPQ